MNTDNFFQLSLKNLSRCEDKASNELIVSTDKNRRTSMPNLQTLRKQPTTPENFEEPYFNDKSSD